MRRTATVAALVALVAALAARSAEALAPAADRRSGPSLEVADGKDDDEVRSKAIQPPVWGGNGVAEATGLGPWPQVGPALTMQGPQAAPTHGTAGQLDARQAIAVASFLTCLLVLAVAPIMQREGVKPFIMVLVYLFSLIAVQPFVKYAMQNGYSNPYSMTVMHMLASCAAALVMERPRLEEATQVLPLAIMSGLCLAFSNTALVFGTAAFVSMVGAYAPATTLALMSMGTCSKPPADGAERPVPGGSCVGWWRSVSPRLAAAVLLVCLGAALCIKTEAAFSSMALLLATLANLCRSCRTVWQHRLLQADLSPCHTVFWTGLWSALLLTPLVAKYEGLQAFTALGRLSMGATLSLVGSVVAAVALNISQCLVIKYIGPLEQTMIGNLQILGVLVLASAWLGETVLPAQWFGVAMIISGCMLTKTERIKKLPEVSEVLARRIRGSTASASAETPQPADP